METALRAHASHNLSGFRKRHGKNQLWRPFKTTHHVDYANGDAELLRGQKEILLGANHEKNGSLLLKDRLERNPVVDDTIEKVIRFYSTAISHYGLAIEHFALVAVIYRSIEEKVRERSGEKHVVGQFRIPPDFKV